MWIIDTVGRTQPLTQPDRRTVRAQSREYSSEGSNAVKPVFHGTTGIAIPPWAGDDVECCTNDLKSPRGSLCACVMKFSLTLPRDMISGRPCHCVESPIAVHASASVCGCARWGVARTSNLNGSIGWQNLLKGLPDVRNGWLELLDIPSRLKCNVAATDVS